MRNIIWVTIIFTFLALPGCARQTLVLDEAPDIKQERAVSDTNDKIISNIKKKYSAVDFRVDENDILFSADVVDEYGDKNVIAQNISIIDVFYDDNDSLFMYAECWDDEKYKLKITPEQYSKIKTFTSGGFDSDICAVLNLENIEPMVPELDAYFTFDISIPERYFREEDSLFTSFGTRVICGTLIDIFELK